MQKSNPFPKTLSPITSDRSGSSHGRACYTAPMQLIRLMVTFLLSTHSGFAQTALQQQIRTIAADARGRVSVACSLPGSTLNCDLDPHAHPPMQSVFKLPLAIAALHLIEQSAFSLDQPIRFLPSDRFLPPIYSPLQDKYPEANVDVPLRELLSLTVSFSDNAAADLVLRTIGGPTVVDNYVESLGVAFTWKMESTASLATSPPNTGTGLNPQARSGYFGGSAMILHSPLSKRTCYSNGWKFLPRGPTELEASYQ